MSQAKLRDLMKQEKFRRNKLAGSKIEHALISYYFIFIIISVLFENLIFKKKILYPYNYIVIIKWINQFVKYVK